LADDLRNEAKAVAPPIRPISLAELLGLRVERAELGQDIAGILVREGERAVIGINWKHHPNRQRFSVAHEIGHYLLHKGGTYVDKDVTARFRDESSGAGTEEEEMDANFFAAALLMPTAWVTRAFREAPLRLGDDRGLEDLARRFRVSTQAMSFRLAYLGLLEL
jgi:Zn-dependent peptidase ImmA (M78 family)